MWPKEIGKMELFIHSGILFIENVLLKLAKKVFIIIHTLLFVDNPLRN